MNNTSDSLTNNNLKRKGVLWNALGSTMYGINSFVMLALVSRFGTVEQTGCFGIAFSTAQILYIVGLFGANNYQMTDYKERFSFYDYLKLKLLSSAALMTGCLLSILIFGFTGEKALYTVILSALMLLNSFAELFQSMFFQKNRLDLSGSALFFRTLWSLVVFSLALIIGKNITSALLVQIICNLGVTLYYIFRYVPNFVSKKPSKIYDDVFETDIPTPGEARIKKKGTLRILIIECLPLCISVFLMNLIINYSKYGIEMYGTDTMQGYFNMIFIPAQFINLCSQFIFKPLLNKYALLLYDNKMKEFFKNLFKQILLVIAFTAFCAAAAYLLGAQILGFVYNKDITSFRLPMTIVVVGGGVYALCQLFYLIFVIQRWQKSIMIIYIASLAMTALLTWLFISSSGITGAASAFLAAHAMILVCYVSIFITKIKCGNKIG